MNRKTKLSIYLVVYAPMHTYGNGFWVLTKGRHCKYQQPKWVFSIRWWGSLLQIVKGTQTSVGSFQHCSFPLKPSEVVRPTPGPLTIRYSGHIQLIGCQRLNPELAGGTTYLIWLGNDSPREELGTIVGERDVWTTKLNPLPL